MSFENLAFKITKLKLKEKYIEFLEEYGKVNYYKTHIIIDSNRPCTCHK